MVSGWIGDSQRTGQLPNPVCLPHALPMAWRIADGDGRAAWNAFKSRWFHEQLQTE